MAPPLKLTQRQELAYLHSLFTNPRSKFFDPTQRKKDATGIHAAKLRKQKRRAAYARLMRWREKHPAQYRLYQRILMRRLKREKLKSVTA